MNTNRIGRIGRVHSIWIKTIAILFLGLFSFSVANAGVYYSDSSTHHIGSNQPPKPPFPCGPEYAESVILTIEFNIPIRHEGQLTVDYEIAHSTYSSGQVRLNGIAIDNIEPRAATCDFYSFTSLSNGGWVAGRNVLEFEAANNHNPGHDDILIRDIVVSGYEAPLEYEVLFAGSDRDIYGPGEEVVVTVETVNNTGSVYDFVVEPYLAAVDFDIPLPASGVHLELGQSITTEHRVNLSEEIGFTRFDIVVELDSSSKSPFVPKPHFEFADRFVANPQYALVEDVRGNVMVCDPGAACANSDDAAYTYLDEEQELIVAEELRCLAGALEAQGDTLGAEVVRYAEKMRESLNVAGQFHGSLLNSGSAAVGVFSAVRVFGESIYASMICSQTAGLESWVSVGGGSAKSLGLGRGAFVHDLADSLSTSGANDYANWADLILVGGQYSISAEVDTLIADLDSIGIYPISLGEFGEDIGAWMCIGEGAGGMGTESKNLNNEVVITITPAAFDTLNVALIHESYLGSSEVLHYSPVILESLSVARMYLAKSISAPLLQIDRDGDGIVDEQFLPNGDPVSVPETGGIVQGHRLFGNYPNPFNPQTTIAFDLPHQTAVRLAVYDVSGRLVDVLLDGDIAAQGRNEVVWRGRDMAGRVVSAGVYFYRLEAGSFSETKRMVLVK